MQPRGKVANRRATTAKNAVKSEAPPAASALSILLLALPWLNPLALGPAHAVVQGLAVWVGAALCCIAWELARVPFSSRAGMLASAWLLAATVSGFMGLLQYLGLAGPFSPLVNFVDAGQAYANLRQRNQLATLLGIGLSALLWWQVELATSVPGGMQRLRSFLMVAVSAALMVASDAATGSRTGMVQLLALFVLAFVWRRGRATMLWALLGYGIAALALPRLIALAPLQSGILGRISEAHTCGSRLVLWSNVLDLIAQKPWFGWGWGELHYAHFVTLYSGERFCEIMGNAHDLPLQLAVELGVPFALLVCTGLVYLVKRGKPWQEQDATRQMAWSVLAIIALHSLLEYPLWYGPFQLAALLAVWMLWQTRPASTEKSAPQVVGRWPVALALCTLLACSYTAWDYWRISQIYLPLSQRDAAYREDTMNKISASWLFSNHVKFAELGIASLTAENAEHIHTLAKEMLHFSPEASVVQKLIESAMLLGQSDEADYYAKRYQVAYPQEYATWLAARSGASHKAP
jgi:O-antigen ligase